MLCRYLNVKKLMFCMSLGFSDLGAVFSVFFGFRLTYRYGEFSIRYIQC